MDFDYLCFFVISSVMNVSLLMNFMMMFSVVLKVKICFSMVCLLISMMIFISEVVGSR